MNEKCNKCWSLNEEDFFDDWCDLIDELEQKGSGLVLSSLRVTRLKHRLATM